MPFDFVICSFRSRAGEPLSFASPGRECWTLHTRQVVSRRRHRRRRRRRLTQQQSQ